jgi:hypothetical protein
VALSSPQKITVRSAPGSGRAPVVGIVDNHGVSALILQATMAPTDVLSANVAIVRNLVANDGKLVGGDKLAITWSCQMDEADTLSSIQEAVDTLMSDGTAATETLNNVTYVVSILPGHVFNVPAQATLSVSNVATDRDILGENDDGDAAGDGRVKIAGPFNLTFDDLPIGDVTLTS